MISSFLPLALALTSTDAADSSNQFGYQLMLKLATQGNMMVSPVSIRQALLMTANGARGSTQAEILKALSVGGKSLDALNQESAEQINWIRGRREAQIGNSLWIKKGLGVIPDFISTCKSNYKAEVSYLDFSLPSSAQIINSWVDKATNHRINKIVDRLERSDRLVLINAVAFKDKWQYQFDPSHTMNMPFHTKHGDKSVKMMSQNTVGYRMATGEEAVVLPYLSGGFEFVAVLPKAGSSPTAVLKELAASPSASFSENGRVQLNLPKFKAEYSTPLNAALQALGMKKAFSDGADFTAMRKERDLSVGQVLHKTFVKVDEEGTEAAAVISVRMRATAVRVPPRPLTFDRPFVYLIRAKESGLVYFAGVMNDPSR